MNISKIPNSLLTEINSVWFGDPSINISIYNLNEFKLSNLYSEGTTLSNGSSIDSETLSRHCYMDYSYNSELDTNIKNEFKIIFNEKRYIDSTYESNPKKINYSGKYISTLFFSKLSMKDINIVNEFQLSPSYNMTPFTGYIDLGDRLLIDNIYSLIVRITINNEIELKYSYASTIDRFKEHSLNEFNKGHQDLMVGYNTTNNHLKFYKSSTIKDIIIQNSSEDYSDELNLNSIEKLDKNDLSLVNSSKKKYNSKIYITPYNTSNLSNISAGDTSICQTNLYINYNLSTILTNLGLIGTYWNGYNISRYTYLGQSHPMGMFRYTFLVKNVNNTSNPTRATRFYLVIIPLDLLQYKKILIYDVSNFSLPIVKSNTGAYELFGNSLIKPIVNFYFNSILINVNLQSYFITPKSSNKSTITIGSNTFEKITYTVNNDNTNIIFNGEYKHRVAPEFNDVLLYDFYNTESLPKSLNLINDLNIYMSPSTLLDSDIGNMYDVANGMYSGYKTNNSFLINNMSESKIWNSICNYYSAYYKMRNIIRWLDENNPSLDQFILFDNFMVYKNNYDRDGDLTNSNKYLIIPYSYKFGNLSFLIGKYLTNCNYIESYGNYIILHSITSTQDEYVIISLNGSVIKSNTTVTGIAPVSFRGVRLNSTSNNTIESLNNI